MKYTRNSGLNSTLTEGQYISSIHFETNVAITTQLGVRESSTVFSGLRDRQFFTVEEKKIKP